MASLYYGITLLGASNEAHDGTCGERMVQIKATQIDRIAISSEPKFLLVLQLAKDGSFKEIYNGPGSRVWALVSSKPRPKNGQYPVSVSQLRELMKGVPDSERLVRVQS